MDDLRQFFEMDFLTTGNLIAFFATLLFLAFWTSFREEWSRVLPHELQKGKKYYWKGYWQNANTEALIVVNEVGPNLVFGRVKRSPRLKKGAYLHPLKLTSSFYSTARWQPAPSLLLAAMVVLIMLLWPDKISVFHWTVLGTSLFTGLGCFLFN